MQLHSQQPKICTVCPNGRATVQFFSQIYGRSYPTFIIDLFKVDMRRHFSVGSLEYGDGFILVQGRYIQHQRPQRIIPLGHLHRHFNLLRFIDYQWNILHNNMGIDNVGAISKIHLYVVFLFHIFNTAEGCAVFACIRSNARKILRNKLCVQINIWTTLDINVRFLYDRRRKIELLRKRFVFIISKQLVSLGKSVDLLRQAVFRHSNRTFQLTRFSVRQIIVHRTRLYPFCIKRHAFLYRIRFKIPLRRIILRSVPTFTGIIVGIFQSPNRRFFNRITFFQFLSQRCIQLSCNIVQYSDLDIDNDQAPQDVTTIDAVLDEVYGETFNLYRKRFQLHNTHAIKNGEYLSRMRLKSDVRFGNYADKCGVEQMDADVYETLVNKKDSSQFVSTHKVRRIENKDTVMKIDTDKCVIRKFNLDDYTYEDAARWYPIMSGSFNTKGIVYVFNGYLLVVDVTGTASKIRISDIDKSTGQSLCNKSLAFQLNATQFYVSAANGEFVLEVK